MMLNVVASSDHLEKGEWKEEIRIFRVCGNSKKNGEGKRPRNRPLRKGKACRNVEERQKNGRKRWNLEGVQYLPTLQRPSYPIGREICMCRGLRGHPTEGHKGTHTRRVHTPQARGRNNSLGSSIPS
jgi:hypothetical protein